MNVTLLFQQLGIALGLGLLVGLQRESIASSLGGVRTFPLVTILGLLCALLAQMYGGWVIGAGLLGMTLLMFSSHRATASNEAPDTGSGLTTETAMLLMFAVGAYLHTGERAVAIAVGAGIAVLLHFKGTLHEVVAQLSANDIKAIMQFAMISLVILPVLPNRTLGPYSVINPRNVWLMIVLIVGISLGGYIIYKFFGARAGLFLGGILGGLISSTATTVSYAKRTKGAVQSVPLAAIVISLASAVVFARLMLEVLTVAPRFFPTASLPLAIMLVALAVAALLLWLRHRSTDGTMPEQENPSELKGAIYFGLLYAGILLLVAAVKQHFGNRGLYVVALISGLTDVDAITLSTSQLVNLGQLPEANGWRVILTAALSNLIFKAGAVFALGDRRLFKLVGTIFGFAGLLGLALILVWPA